jgi:hypothetical protein
MRTTYKTLTLLLLVTLGAGSALADPLLVVDRFDEDELRVTGFELTQDATIEVDALGARPRHSDHLSAYGWILDADSREVVWSMDEERTHRNDDNRYLREASATLDLPKGRYELYYWAGTRRSGYNVNFGNLSRFLRGHWDDQDDWRDSRWDLEDALEECRMTLSSDNLPASSFRTWEPDGSLPNTLLANNKLGDSEHLETGFELTRDTELRVYAVIEFPDDWRHPADHAWIRDARSREVLWQMEWRDTEPAGGAKKNRKIDTTISLPKGKYVLVAGTDDSHSWEEFNAAPPADPMNWGITLLATANTNKGAFKLIDIPERGEPFLDMTRVRDYEFIEKAFRLKKKGTLQVYALGEYSSGDREFVDYGWIQKADSDEIVWEMTRRNTRHAGGAEKNRQFDGTVELEAGEYVAMYVSDDSHSYRRWNADAPFDRRAWGMTIWPGDDLSSGDLEAVPMDQLKRNANVILNITRVGDDERLRERFSLDKETRVLVYALGEGTDGRMYDFGYIVNDDTDDVVWEMTYRRSRHAGGARKNRYVSEEITLPPGRYTVYYESDGSHSFPDWNARRPRDPRKWGITISKAQ